jgi:hypothetical protein
MLLSEKKVESLVAISCKDWQGVMPCEVPVKPVLMVLEVEPEVTVTWLKGMPVISVGQE